MEGLEKLSFLKRDGELLLVPTATVTVIQLYPPGNIHNLRKKHVETSTECSKIYISCHMKLQHKVKM